MEETELKNNLARYKRKISSQFGEDGILEKIFKTIPDSDRWCVDVGAGNGRTYSNTWNLITAKRWSGVLIECNPVLMDTLRATHRGNPTVLCIHKEASFESPDTLDEILPNAPVTTGFDLLSVDVDGNDYHLWQAMMLYQPKVVLIEFNPTIPNDTEFIQPRNLKVKQGSSLLSLTHLAMRKGYELVATTECNAFFVKREYFMLFGIRDNSLSAIRKESYQSRLFQLYDGTLMLSGQRSFLWQPHLDIEQSDIQVFPRFMWTCPPPKSCIKRFFFRTMRFLHRKIY